jgi:ubiquinone biosynthesis protein
MPTQPQLLMLQKTMVVVEGVARSLDPNLNMFEVARPVIEDWMARNLGPAARFAQALRLGARVMTYLDRLTASDSPVPPSPPPITPTPATPNGLGLSLPVALSLAALALALLSLVLRH